MKPETTCQRGWGEVWWLGGGKKQKKHNHKKIEGINEKDETRMKHERPAKQRSGGRLLARKRGCCKQHNKNKETQETQSRTENLQRHAILLLLCSCKQHNKKTTKTKRNTSLRMKHGAAQKTCKGTQSRCRSVRANSTTKNNKNKEKHKRTEQNKKPAKARNLAAVCSRNEGVANSTARGAVDSFVLDAVERDF
jgi:hypothetical protein